MRHQILSENAPPTMKVNLGETGYFLDETDSDFFLGRRVCPFGSGSYFVDAIMGFDGQLSFLALQSELSWAYSLILFVVY